jgi:hypothetical protein
MKIGTAFIVLVGSSFCHEAVFAQSDRAPSSDREIARKSVLASDLLTRVSIIGSLGVPLWQVTKIRGAWKDPGPLAKDATFRFLVTEIDGRRLESPIEFFNVIPISDHGLTTAPLDGITWDWRSSPDGDEAPPSRPKVEQEWELVVVETGRTFMYSDEVIREAFGNIAISRRGFVTELEYLRVRRIR